MASGYHAGMEASAGIVLAGGRSSRMGTPKAALEWHGSTLLHRTVSIVARATGGPVVVVRAPGQDLPDLPCGTLVVWTHLDFVFTTFKNDSTKWNVQPVEARFQEFDISQVT